MLCQKCQEQEATVHIDYTKTIATQTNIQGQREHAVVNLCEGCAKEYQLPNSSRTLFPHLHQEQVREQVRVMSITPEVTVWRLIRTEANPTPEDWAVLTSRVPTQPVGTELTVVFTQAELEWMKGQRELG